MQLDNFGVTARVEPYTFDKASYRLGDRWIGLQSLIVRIYDKIAQNPDKPSRVNLDAL